MKVAASPRIYMGRCPKGFWESWFLLAFFYHRAMSRERKRFLALLEMTIQENQMSPSLLVS